MRTQALYSTPRSPVHRLPGRYRTRVLAPEAPYVKDTASGKYVIKIGPQNPKYKRILSIDGGGLRGLVPAQVLKYVEQDIVDYAVEKGLAPKGVPKSDLVVDLADYFDVIAGTSVGSIMALYVASKGAASEGLLKEIGCPDLRPGSAEAMVQIIARKGTTIFPKSWVPNWPKIGGLTPRDLVLLFGPKYSSKGLIDVLTAGFGDLTLKDTFTRVVIPSYDLNTKRAFTFFGGENASGYAAVNNHATKTSNFSSTEVDPQLSYVPDIDIDDTKDYNLWQVALSSSSAPTYFPPAKVTSLDPKSPLTSTLVDGGVVALNPTIQAIMYYLLGEPSEDAAKVLEETTIFSVGTGGTLPDTSHLIDAGALGWLKAGALINILMDGSAQYLQAVTDAMYYGVEKLPLAQYVRINKIVDTGSPDAEEFSEMDNTDDIPGLLKAGDKLGELYSQKVIPYYVENFLLAEKESNHEIP